MSGIFFEGIEFEFPADEVFEARRDVASDVLGADRAARDEPIVFNGLTPRDGFKIGENTLVSHGQNVGISRRKVKTAGPRGSS